MGVYKETVKSVGDISAHFCRNTVLRNLSKSILGLNKRELTHKVELDIIAETEISHSKDASEATTENFNLT